MVDRPRNVVISGLTAAGKTTHSRLLSSEFGMTYVCAAELLLESAKIDPASIPPDFWITQEGVAFLGRVPWTSVDDELKRVESGATRTVFDCFALPWLHARECLAVWIESSPSSRLLKAIVSHQGISSLSRSEVEAGLATKDDRARTLLFEKYNVDMYLDRSPFQLVVDISSFITDATEEASSRSIASAQEILSAAVGWYVEGSDLHRERFRRCHDRYGGAVILKAPDELMATGE